jgi:4-amino-4-deoxy-L-arabinose transferase-like glycosyltransferase
LQLQFAANTAVTEERSAGEDQNATRQREFPGLFRRFATRDTLVFLAVFAVLAVFWVHALQRCDEFGLSEDESRHAVTGLYFADFLSDLPLSNPVGYTYRYYAQYPALGLIHWPPFFHFTEGVMFLLAGRSADTARLTTLLFASVGLFFWFRLVKELTNVWAAAICTFLLALLPSIYLFSQSVMLEVPSLALVVVATFFWVRFLRTGRGRFLYLFALSAALAILTKQHTIYLLTFCAITTVTERAWPRLLTWTGVRAAALAALLVAPYYVFAFKVHGDNIQQHIVQSRPYTWHDFTFYLRELPEMLGWPALVMSILGAVFCLLRGNRRHARWMLLWILACYASFTLLRARDARYVLYWFPPLLYFVSWPLITTVPRRRLRVVAVATCALIVASYGWAAWRSVDYPVLSGYSETAEWLDSASQGRQVVLFDGPHNGNFVFQMRVHDRERRFIVIRKGLYVVNIIKFFGNKELVKSGAEIQELLARYGIRYVVVSDDPRGIEFPAQTMLRELLQTSQFKLWRAFPATFGRETLSHNRLLVYENLQAVAPSASQLVVPMMTLGEDIVVPLDEIGNP